MILTQKEGKKLKAKLCETTGQNALSIMSTFYSGYVSGKHGRPSGGWWTEFGCFCWATSLPSLIAFPKLGERVKVTTAEVHLSPGQHFKTILLLSNNPVKIFLSQHILLFPTVTSLAFKENLCNIYFQNIKFLPQRSKVTEQNKLKNLFSMKKCPLYY